MTKTSKLSLVASLLLFAACTDDDLGPDEDPIDDCVTCDGKDDRFGIADASPMADAILMVVNTMPEIDLQAVVRLSRRAAMSIAEARSTQLLGIEVGRIQTLRDLDDVPYVGRGTFLRLVHYIESNTLDAPCTGGTEFVGNVVIKTVRDLVPLQAVTRITGSLTIDASDRPSLDGLEKLRCVSRLVIRGNTHLTRIDGLRNLQEVTGSVVIEDNDELPNLHGLGGLARVGGDVQVSFPHSRRQDPAWHALRTVGGVLTTNRPGFHGLTSVGADVAITPYGYSSFHEHPIVMNLPRLSTVGGSLRIQGGDQLFGLSLPELTRVGHQLVASNMRTLRTLTLPKLESVGAGGVEIRLSKLSENIDLSSLVSVDGSFLADGTAGTLDVSNLTRVGALTLHAATTTDFPVLTTVASIVMTRSATFPSLREVPGSVSIDGPMWDDLGLGALENIGGSLSIVDIRQADLHGLELLAAVRGDVTLKGAGSANFTHDNMGRFASLTEIGGSLQILDNEGMADLRLFSSLKTVAKNASISSNRNLASLRGLEQLRSVGGHLSLSGAQIAGITSRITTMAPLRDLNMIAGNIFVVRHPLLPYADVMGWADKLILHHGWNGTLTVQSVGQ